MKPQYFILAAVGLPCAILAGVLGLAVYPHWAGRPIVLRVQPIDPRDLFMGHYARLAYDFNRIPLRDFREKPEKLLAGEPIYLLLKEAQGEWVAAGATLVKPQDGVFLKGHVTRTVNLTANPGYSHVDVNYGIETFYTSPARAAELERQFRVRAGATVTHRVKVMVAPNGQAAVKEVDPA